MQQISISMLTSSPTASIDGVVNDSNRLTVSRLGGAFHTGIIIIIVAGTTSYTECPHYSEIEMGERVGGREGERERGREGERGGERGREGERDGERGRGEGRGRGREGL